MSTLVNIGPFSLTIARWLVIAGTAQLFLVALISIVSPCTRTLWECVWSGSIRVESTSGCLGSLISRIEVPSRLLLGRCPT